MISERMIAMSKNSSAIRAMFEEGARLAALYGSENVYDFSLGNPNFPAPDALNRAIVQVLEDTEFALLLVATWNIWNRRNKWLHDRILLPPSVVADYAKLLSKETEQTKEELMMKVECSREDRWKKS